MKSMMKNLTLLSLGLLIYSCNEKISPEIEDGSATTIPSAVAPDEYYFKVTNNSATILNYNLHKTGNGNATTECKVSSTGTALSSTLYIGDVATAQDSKAYDIACYMEAEELSLYFNGLDFGIEASKNTCEYVAYSPYSYFDAIPGDSTSTWAAVDCDGATTAHVLADAVAEAIAIDATLDGVTPLNCDMMVDTSVPIGSRVAKSIPESMTSYCSFDYETNGGGNDQNCDIGTIYYTSIIVTREDIGDPAVTTTMIDTTPTAKTECGGTVVACVEGAIKQIDTDAVRMSEIYNSPLNEDFSKEFTLPALIGVKSSMHDIVNFRKGLASMDLNFLDYTVPNETQWSDTNYNKSFDPNLMEKYAANKSPDNVTIIDAAAIVAEAQLPHGYTKTKFAADPFLGVGGYRVNPFYTFYCLDRAYEIKARIRMVVRDWDRVFSSTASDLELISDSYMTVASRRQDLPSSEEEFPNDPGSYNFFNDKDDWDVLVEMNRSDPNLTGVYDPGDTLWTPTVGWWDPSIFPNEGPAEGSEE